MAYQSIVKSPGFGSADAGDSAPGRRIAIRGKAGVPLLVSSALDEVISPFSLKQNLFFGSRVTPNDLSNMRLMNSRAVVPFERAYDMVIIFL